MIAPSPDAFADEVAAHRLGDVPLDPRAVDAARTALDAAGMILVGETHGLRETPNVIHALMHAIDADAIAFEWAHEEMSETLQACIAGRPVDLHRLWSLPPEAEFFSGDGRITAGHLVMLERLRDAGRLRQAIAFDRLDPDPVPPWWERDRDMAERLLTNWDGNSRLVAVTGRFHTRADVTEGATLAIHLTRAISHLRAATIDYAAGFGWFNGATFPLTPVASPDAIQLLLPSGSPAVVPGPTVARSGVT